MYRKLKAENLEKIFKKISEGTTVKISSKLSLQRVSKDGQR